ncbi:adenomatous polyposis coli protein-like [Anopheles bellator]|uniref:adenomatous polyposis coli protein-like n=1 Tax=Anopheles bellator TaxID=139047 RepID=UPI002649CDBD|nr:adenomatous polyposis coli protein-like [Anopheles bellator]
MSPPAPSSLDERELERCMAELEILDDQLADERLSRKPHFLDYDNKSPGELEDRQEPTLGASLPSPTVPVVSQFRYLPNNGKEVPMDDLAHQMNSSCDTVPVVYPKPSPFGGTWPMKERVRSARNGSQLHPVVGSEVGPKMECVYSLLAMLGSTNVLEMSNKFLELSRSDEKCAALRRAGCVPMLVHIIHNDPNEHARKNARLALVNVIRANGERNGARRELKVLRLVDHLIDYAEMLKEQHATMVQDEFKTKQRPAANVPEEQERRPIQAICTMAKISYDEEHRRAMCQFGALQTIASLIQLDHLVHGTATDVSPKCIELRRYASMVLTNLTFGQGNNKALLCANRDFMQALIAQLARIELVQVTASVLRNLSWRADTVTKQTLAEIGTVRILTEAAMHCTVENTLKSILSALWNLSNHCAHNRSRICEVEGALEFLTDLLTYDAPSKTMAIVENAGGILRNISNHIAQSDSYRQVLRRKGCLKILLDQLKSPSLTVVSNACGTLGNLSSGSPEDQLFLRENGAISMLRSLIYSKHNIISSGSRLALRNLQHQPHLRGPCPGTVTLVADENGDHYHAASKMAVASTAVPLNAFEAQKELPSLNVRKQRAIEQEQLESAFFAKPNASVERTEEDELETDDDDEVKVQMEDLVMSMQEKEDEGGEERELVKSEVEGFDQTENESDTSVRSPEPVPSQQSISYGLLEDLQQTPSYDYQETDIDQLTDYSLRYAENQSDSDEGNAEQDGEPGVEDRVEHCEKPYQADAVVGMLIPEDSVKCYYTEGTPQIISSATSMSDLRMVAAPSVKTTAVHKSNPIPISQRMSVAGAGPAVVSVGRTDDLGSNTPDKPYNYCEEGTPDFSRDDSLTIHELDDAEMATEVFKEDAGERGVGKGTPTAPPTVLDPIDSMPTPSVGAANASATDSAAVKSVSFLNTAEETPLMFSRTSSMGSLSSAEPVCTDDKSSIVSEFSRLASGVISPSELPDSPTQTIAHSPHRAAGLGETARENILVSKQCAGEEQAKDETAAVVMMVGEIPESENPHEAVPISKDTFAEAVNVNFQVTHTPALFSCSTSLSNLSIEGDEAKKVDGAIGQHLKDNRGEQGTSKGMAMTIAPLVDSGARPPPVLPHPATLVTMGSNGIEGGNVSDGDSDAGGDDELLASCISIGMSSVVARNATTKKNKSVTASRISPQLPFPAAPGTPGNQSSELEKQVPNGVLPSDQVHGQGNDSDDSTSGGMAENSDQLVEECIRTGMSKPKQQPPAEGKYKPPDRGTDRRSLPYENEHLFRMMRTTALPTLLATDELNPFHVENSPCNFSIASGLSDLTVASETNTGLKLAHCRMFDVSFLSKLFLLPRLEDNQEHSTLSATHDSLSSLSLESDNDDHILDEAIAAGIGSKAQHSGSRLPMMQAAAGHINNSADDAADDDSMDSIDSIFANDPQNDSLLEQAIETGMKGGMMTEYGPITGYEFQAGMLYGTISYQREPEPAESLSDRHDDDYELLAECIHVGMQGKSRTSGTSGTAVTQDSNTQKAPGGARRSHIAPYSSSSSYPPPTASCETVRVRKFQRPKNVQTTPVMLTVAGAAEASAGVVERQASWQTTHPLGTSAKVKPAVGPVAALRSSTNIPAPSRRYQPTAINNIRNSVSSNHCKSTVNTSTNAIITISGSGLDHDNITVRLLPSSEWMNLRYNRQVRLHSAAITATSGIHVAPTSGGPKASGDRSASVANGCEQAEKQPHTAVAIEKHKDPKQMLQSVERLTERLVSRTQYFRPVADDGNSVAKQSDDGMEKSGGARTAIPKNVTTSRPSKHLTKLPKQLSRRSSVTKPGQIRHRPALCIVKTATAVSRPTPTPCTGRTAGATTIEPKPKPSTGEDRKRYGNVSAASPTSQKLDKLSIRDTKFTTTTQVLKSKPTLGSVTDSGKRRLSVSATTVNVDRTRAASALFEEKSKRKSLVPAMLATTSASVSSKHRPPTLPGEAIFKRKTNATPMAAKARPAIGPGEQGSRSKPNMAGDIGCSALAAPFEKTKNKLPTASGGIDNTEVSAKLRQRTFVFDRPKVVTNGPHLPVSSWILKRRVPTPAQCGGVANAGSVVTDTHRQSNQSIAVVEHTTATERIPKMSLPMYGNF